MGGHKRAPSGAAMALRHVRRYSVRFVALAALTVPVVAVVADQGGPAASGRDRSPDALEGQHPEVLESGESTQTPTSTASQPASATPSPLPTAGRPDAGGSSPDPGASPRPGAGTDEPQADVVQDGPDGETTGPRPSDRPDGETAGPQPSSPPDDGTHEPQPSPSSTPQPTHQPPPSHEPSPTPEPPITPPQPTQEPPEPSETPKPSAPTEEPPDDDDGSLVCIEVLGIQICL
ncbi:hypothetical protein [Jiangella alkaliphila]|nr:hypothetical protein [Jiangella alkaliphila]